VRLEVGASSVVLCTIFEIGALDKGLIDLLVSHFVCPSFWFISIVFEVH